MFNNNLREALEDRTENPPPDENSWHTTWNGILYTLFPLNQGYFIAPQHIVLDDEETKHLPDLAVIHRAGGVERTILIVKIKRSAEWPAGIAALGRQINRVTDAAFDRRVVGLVYWIGAIGPHWWYGVKVDDGMNPQPSIRWRDTTHDQQSFNHFQALVALV